MEELFSARVPTSSAAVRRVFIHDIKEVEDVGQQEQQGDKRDNEEGDEVKEKSKRSETTLTTCMDDYGMNGDSNLSRLEPDSVRASNLEDSQGTMTRTYNKKRDYENEGSSMHDGSCIGNNYNHRFP